MIPNIGISLSYHIPEGYDLSSVHKQIRNGEVWWIVWTCKMKPEIDRDHRVHFARGEDKELLLALDKALRATMDHEQAMNKLKAGASSKGNGKELIGDIEDLF